MPFSSCNWRASSRGKSSELMPSASSINLTFFFDFQVGAKIQVQSCNSGKRDSEHRFIVRDKNISPLDIPRSKFSGYQHVWTNPTHRRLNNLVRVGVIPLAPGKDSSWFHAWQLGIPNDMDFPWNEIMEWNEISAEILSNKSVLLAITWSFHCHSSSTFAT